MDKERPNEQTWLSSRLEEPGALPGLGLTDKEAAWDKLYERLSERPRRRNLTWLWAAAACILLALIPAAVLLKEKRAFPLSGKPTKIPVGYPSLGSSDTSDFTMQSPARVYTPTRVHKPVPKKALAHTLPLPAKHQPDQSVSPDSSLKAMVFAPRPDLNKPLAIATLPPAPKKELRVIHINELNPQQPTPSTAGERERPGRLRIGPVPQESFRPATTYETGHTIFSFKHSQNP